MRFKSVFYSIVPSCNIYEVAAKYGRVIPIIFVVSVKNTSRLSTAENSPKVKFSQSVIFVVKPLTRTNAGRTYTFVRLAKHNHFGASVEKRKIFHLVFQWFGESRLITLLTANSALQILKNFQNRKSKIIYHGSRGATMPVSHSNHVPFSFPITNALAGVMA